MKTEGNHAMNEVMRFLTIFVGSMMIISILITLIAVPNLTPPFTVWIAIWFIILWRYPGARWWAKQGNKIEKLDWFSLVTTAIAILCLEYITFLMLVDYVFPIFQAILDLMKELFSQPEVPWMPIVRP